MDAARLKSIPLFADLGDDALHSIASYASEVSVPAGKELVREGDWSYEVLAIEEGTAIVERDGATIADLGPGDVIGEAGVLTQGHRNATVTATSGMMLLTLDRWDLKKLAKSAPATMDRLAALMQARGEDPA